MLIISVETIRNEGRSRSVQGRTGMLFFSRRESKQILRRTLLIAAHPDDETIGAGALLRRRPNIKVIHVTDGSPLNASDALGAGFTTREEYAEARRKETVQALAQAGIRDDAITNLQFTDQQLSFQLKEVTRESTGSRAAVPARGRADACL